MVDEVAWEYSRSAGRRSGRYAGQQPRDDPNSLKLVPGLPVAAADPGTKAYCAFAVLGYFDGLVDGS